MKKLLYLLTIGLSSTAFAADKDKGKAKFQSTCVACHGTEGVGTSEAYPNLAGQKESYIKKQLNDFKGGVVRKDPTMQSFANMISEEDIKNIAAYLSDLKSSK